jgi:nitrite reductase/ring-hydroxylating ferredoxin subunit
LAYALLIGHVTLGALQSETSPLLAAVLAVGLTIVTALHLAAAFAERRKDRERAAASNGFVPVCDLDNIPEKRACVVSCGGERVAVFKYDGRISAVSGVCQHQNGPLGEGKIIDGCITCPWHGYQYLPESGASPPPFTEKVPTFRTLIVGSQVFVHPSPLPPGTRVEPSVIQQESKVVKNAQRV